MLAKRKVIDIATSSPQIASTCGVETTEEERYGKSHLLLNLGTGFFSEHDTDLGRTLTLSRHFATTASIKDYLWTKFLHSP